MKVEFAITDNDGKLFGLPARLFNSHEGADDLLTYLGERRTEMELEANKARDLLTGPFQTNVTGNYKQALEDQVTRWDAEKTRSYRIVQRPVGEWEAVPGSACLVSKS